MHAKQRGKGVDSFRSHLRITERSDAEISIPSAKSACSLKYGRWMPTFQAVQSVYNLTYRLITSNPPPKLSGHTWQAVQACRGPRNSLHF